ncbi:PEGA domain-containing protein [Gracilimonas sp.]|uniref:PEGA domain-containing protein n=1 Tax=Gracilimonas TaxID=649462 RepID=UPI0025B9F1B9|nr:PEGA domain-containing protein [Gracilimonas sp.]
MYKINIRSTLYILGIFVFGFSSITNLKAQDQNDGPSEMRVVEGSVSISSGELIQDRDDNRDINGNLAAGIRVKSDLTGLVFEARNGIIKTVQDPGSTLLYLSANERMVTVYKNGYIQLDIVLNDVGIDLDEGKVWELIITGDKDASIAPVQFRVNPENSTLIIDGTPRLLNTTVFDTSLTTGVHYIQVRKPQYAFVNDTITVSAETTNNPSYNLQRINPIPVTITSEPAGASVTLNDEPGSRGTTPLTIREYPGEYKIELTLDGYSRVVDEIDFTGENTEFNYNLQEFVGYLSVSLSPENAVLLIDNEIISDYDQIKLRPGVYSLEARAPGYDRQQENITIELGDSLSREINLTQITGNLFFSIDQENANVSLLKNGQEIESWQGNFSKEGLPVGMYEIRASLNNFETKTRQIEIIRDYDQIISMDLAQIDGKGALTVDGIFEEAEITLKGPGFSREYSTMPFTLPSLTYGTYEVTIEKDGFDDVTKEVQVNSLSQEITFVDEFQPRSKGKAVLRSVIPGAVFPGVGHGYLGKGGRGWLYFLAGGGALAYSIKSYVDYNNSYNKYQTALDLYKKESAGSNRFEELRSNYRGHYQDADDALKQASIGLSVYLAIKGVEIVDLMLQKSNKKKLENAKIEFNARNNGLSMRVNF